MTQIFGCLAAMDSQDPTLFNSTTEAPTCEVYDPSWNQSVAESKGYGLCWEDGTSANHISGAFIFGVLSLYLFISISRYLDISISV